MLSEWAVYDVTVNAALDYSPVHIPIPFSFDQTELSEELRPCRCPGALVDLPATVDWQSLRAT